MLTLLPKIGAKWHWAGGQHGKLGKSPIHLARDKLSETETDKRFSLDGWRVDLPAVATLDWPALPYDQYVKDGTPPVAQGRIVVTIPLGRSPKESTVQIHVGD